VPQMLHECALLEHLEESLTYNPERICQVWPSRFPTLASAIPYSHNPKALANKVYAGRMGNRDEASGDGWRYRGRCPIMLTGHAAYLHVGDVMGQDLVVLPDLILQQHYGLVAARCWWEGLIPDSMLSDQTVLRRRVNGSTLGLPQVLALRTKLDTVLA
jgi:putative chitinase